MASRSWTRPWKDSRPRAPELGRIDREPEDQVMVAERGVVLIVEDSPELAELMAAIVEREGFTGIAAGSAAEARAAYLRFPPVAGQLDWGLSHSPLSAVYPERWARDP